MPNVNMLSIAGLHAFCHFVLLVFHLQVTAYSGQAKAVKPADVMLGGLFPIHKSAKDETCNLLFREGVVLAEAMMQAVELVNKNKMLPNEITLGYDIHDTCDNILTALKTSLGFVNEKKTSERSLNFSSRLMRSSMSTENPIAVVGAGNSVLSAAVNNILSIFRVPQIGYASTSRILSNKKLYPTFLRMVPPDSHQGRAIAKIVLDFQWNYVALLASDDIYGRPLAETFKIEVNKFGVCVALDMLISQNPTVTSIRKTVGKIRKDKNIEVILLFTFEKEAIMILNEAAKQNITKRLWIGSDSWADSPKIAEDNANVVDGMFRIINQPTVVPDFMRQFYRLNPLNDSHNPWFAEFWEKTFHCTFLEKNVTFLKRESSLRMKNCSGREKLSTELLVTDAVFSRVSYVFDAVFSVVFSIRKICEKDLTSDEMSRKEACIKRVTPSSLLSHIFNVTFTSVTNQTVSFDSNGDGNGHYDIINLQRYRKDKVGTSFLKIGEYNGKTGLLNLQSHAIHWPGAAVTPPYGRCSQNCPPGTFKVVLKPICCWVCKPCPSGSISNNSDVSSCMQCQWGKIANINKTSCVVIPMNFLSWESVWAWVLIATMILCELACTFTVFIFLRYKKTPIVKAANREISFLLLFGLFVGFLIPFAYIGRPTDRGCKMQVILFGASFSFSLSIVLARINRTIVVFRYSKVTPRNKSKFLQKYLNMFLYNRTQIMLALFFTVIELLLCFASLLSNPPRVIVRQLTVTESLLMCEAATSIGHIVSNAFIIFLSFLCTFVAFKSRKLPQNYNEAKFISFAMFVFNFIWLTFVGAFYGTPDGQHNVITNCFAILASNFAILALIFGPKLYIILLRPGLNQMAVFRALTARYTFRSSRRSSALTSDMMGSSSVLKENKCVQTSCTMSEDRPEVKERTIYRTGTVSNEIEVNKGTLRSRDMKKKTEKYPLFKRVHIGGLNTKAVSDTALNTLFEQPRDSREIPKQSFHVRSFLRRGSVIEEVRRSRNGTESVKQKENFEKASRSLIGKELTSEKSFLHRTSVINGQPKCTPICESVYVPSLKKNNAFSIGTYQINCEFKGIMESDV